MRRAERIVRAGSVRARQIAARQAQLGGALAHNQRKITSREGIEMRQWIWTLGLAALAAASLGSQAAPAGEDGEAIRTR
jgi:hypothetical protein